MSDFSIPIQRKTVFVVGLGMVGLAFIEKLLSLSASPTSPQYFIRTCGEEPTLAYNRVGLTEYFQHRNIEELYLNGLQWYEDQEPERFAWSTGEQVVEVDSASRRVRTDKGNEYEYDILVLATGSGAGLPSYVSQAKANDTKGIFVYRNIADLENIINYAQSNPSTVTRASVVGGGLLGLEAAKAVYDIPSIPSVEIIIRQGYPLNRQLDPSAGALVLSKIEALGVKVRTHTQPVAITTTPSFSDDGEQGETFTGFEFEGGEMIESDLVIFAIGIKPRDDLAGGNSGIKRADRGGFQVDDALMTNVEGVYAIGECASWRGHTYGLIAPGVEMADILAFNLTQTSSHAPRKMNTPDLSTKLKLMGVDVASFGDFFADDRQEKELTLSASAAALLEAAERAKGVVIQDATPRTRKVGRRKDGDPIKCLTYEDPFSGTYKKFIFSGDGQYLIGGIMIGDTGAFTKLVAIVKKKKMLEIPPSEFIIGAKKDGEDDGGDLDDDAQICSCHNVLKGAIGACIKEGITELGKIRSKTKAGAGCGGCVPLVTSIYKAEMKKAGHATNNHLCPHFPLSRADLFSIVRIKKLLNFDSVLLVAGGEKSKHSVGCEICKPAVASILSSTSAEHIMLPKLHGLQETNDRFMANIQRDGTFSVVPRIPGGEVTPEGLIAIGQVAKKFKLYSKITGGQRIDLFGAHKKDLPEIWELLIDAGFESGQAYGKSLRTVKSCVGSNWCRYGIGDAVGMAIDLENRYKGVRSPHKFKGGISGCVRECAEAQSKDFGLIASDKGWNIYLGGNGGAVPRHANLFASDVPPSKVVRIIDRFLMFYIRTAERLQRTARWIENFEGGIDKLKKIILDDELGICADLDREMDALIGTYVDEWRKAVTDPELRKTFKTYVNSEEAPPVTIEQIPERGQNRPADWPKAFPAIKFEEKDISTPRAEWKWIKVATTEDMIPTDDNTTSAAVRYGTETTLAVFHVPKHGYFATQQTCPHKRAAVLDHGIIGDDANGNLYVSCPLHKRNFRLDTGECLNDAEYRVLAFSAREIGGDIELLLPPPEDLDALIGSSKWMIKKATAEAFGKNAATAIVEIVGPGNMKDVDGKEEGRERKVAGGECETDTSAGAGCGGSKLEW